MHKPKLDQTENFIWLLLTLIALFFFDALFNQLQLELMSGLVSSMITVSILVAVWSLEMNRLWMKARTGITVLLCLMLAMDFLFKHFELGLLRLAVLIILALATIYYCARSVLFSGHIDTNKIVGAICIYMLLAMTWGLIYSILEILFPGSIQGLSAGIWGTSTDNAMYFSFVTLTSLGYGDITPVQPLARYFAYMQAMTGQFYTAILVASMIGVRLADRNKGQAG